MRRNKKTVKHRPVIDRRQGRNISQEPEMIELKELFADMTTEEKDRTAEYLKDEATKKRG
jgi:ABC-type uncharacterized transport system ATPase subunit